MERKPILKFIEKKLGRKPLYWFGTRGADALPLLEISNFSGSFSITAPLSRLNVVKDVCLENLSGQRVDLDKYSFDEDCSPWAKQLRSILAESLARPCAVLPYRALESFSSIFFPQHDVITYYGLFHLMEAAFKHKPWVETSLAKEGVRIIPWQYTAANAKGRVLEALAGGPMVLRPCFSDGGASVQLVHDEISLDAKWPNEPEGYVSFSPFLDQALPINVNACVFPNGTVSFHGLSVQLIGTEGLTHRRFGYCGNDFGAARYIEPALIEEIQTLVEKCGTWLCRHNYVGAFGVDALVHNGKVYFIEINSRFQGSSALSAVIDLNAGRMDIFLAQIAAFMGAEIVKEPLSALVRQQADCAQAILHNLSGGDMCVGSSCGGDGGVTLLPQGGCAGFTQWHGLPLHNGPTCRRRTGQFDS